ncbi:MAG: sugar transferase [Thermomicrobiales bacterium]
MQSSTKRLFDIVLAVALLILLSPLLLLIAALVYIDSPGKPIFRQARTGYHGRRFLMFKFRTMVPNAEELKAKLAHLNVLQPPDFKIPNDPRITRVGRFLRKTSLDELPQLLNILQGDMSFVGPRPTSFKPETYSPWHGERLEVKPGLTGLWQVEGRGSMEFDERLRLDIWYLRNWSLWLDLKLLWLTAISVLRRRGAY